MNDTLTLTPLKPFSDLTKPYTYWVGYGCEIVLYDYEYGKSSIFAKVNIFKIAEFIEINGGKNHADTSDGGSSKYSGKIVKEFNLVERNVDIYISGDKCFATFGYSYHFLEKSNYNVSQLSYLSLPTTYELSRVYEIVETGEFVVLIQKIYNPTHDSTKLYVGGIRNLKMANIERYAVMRDGGTTSIKSDAGFIYLPQTMSPTDKKPTITKSDEIVYELRNIKDNSLYQVEVELIKQILSLV